jgi:signal transduction histidine kinase
VPINKEYFMRREKKVTLDDHQYRERMQILKSVNIFQDSTEDILAELARSMEEVNIGQGEVVFHKGDLLHAMYIIVEGRVKVHDEEHEFTQFQSRQYFGEYSLIDSSVRSASVTTMEDTRLLRLDKTVFDNIISKNVDIARAILKALIKRLRSNNILEEQLTQKSYELKQEKEEIEKKRKELEELNATKDKFFSIIAHDLKNPFNTVIGLSELLLYRYDSYDEDKIKEFIGQINKFSSNAYNLLDNLLQWARSQTNRIKVNKSQVNICKLAKENTFLLQDKADEKNIQLINEVDGSLICWVDKNMINTVIRNLISNALKFTEENGYVKIVSENMDDNKVKISVVDNGVGMDKEDIPKLFNITTNFSSEGTNSEAGTGLGLILCKEFIEKNDGEIWAESEKGKGSSFSFTIPKA